MQILGIYVELLDVIVVDIVSSTIGWSDLYVLIVGGTQLRIKTAGGGHRACRLHGGT